MTDISLSRRMTIASLSPNRPTRSALAEFAKHAEKLEAELAKAQRAVEVVAAIEEMIPPSDFGSLEISHIPDDELEDGDDPWMVISDLKMYFGPDLPTAILNAKAKVS